FWRANCVGGRCAITQPRPHPAIDIVCSLDGFLVMLCGEVSYYEWFRNGFESPLPRKSGWPVLYSDRPINPSPLPKSVRFSREGPTVRIPFCSLGGSFAATRRRWSSAPPPEFRQTCDLHPALLAEAAARRHPSTPCRKDV